MRRGSFAVTLALVLIGTACGGDGSSGIVGGAEPTDGGGPVMTTSPAGGDCTEDTATDLSGDDPFTISIENLRWSPGCVMASGSASITVVNDDAVDHTFTIPGTQVDAPLPGNQTFNGESAALAPGTYEFICTIHPEITGTIIVV